jgi:hypothetical protein
MKNRAVLLFISLIALALIDSCTMVVSDTKVKTEVYKQDTGRGYAYPLNFDRARELRTAQMFNAAAYIYIMLYNDAHDSVISESMAMADEIKAIDSTQSVAYYFQQAIGTEMMVDPQVRKPGEEINKKEMRKRYQWSSDLMNELATKGIR